MENIFDWYGMKDKFRVEGWQTDNPTLIHPFLGYLTFYVYHQYSKLLTNIFWNTKQRRIYLSFYHIHQQQVLIKFV